MSKSWRVPREGPKQNIRPSGPHKQKRRDNPTWLQEWEDEENYYLHLIDEHNKDHKNAKN